MVITVCNPAKHKNLLRKSMEVEVDVAKDRGDGSAAVETVVVVEKTVKIVV